MENGNDLRYWSAPLTDDVMCDMRAFSTSVGEEFGGMPLDRILVAVVNVVSRFELCLLLTNHVVIGYAHPCWIPLQALIYRLRFLGVCRGMLP